MAFRQSKVNVIAKQSSVCVLFSTLLIATYAINYPVALGLRPVDIVFILFVAWGVLRNPLKPSRLLILINLFYVVYSISALYGAMCIGITNPRNCAFIYKYSILFICVWVFLSSRLNERQIRYLLKLLFLSFILVVVYVFLSMYTSRYLYPESAYKFRPTFPFTEAFPEETNGYLGDSHLLAAYISTGLLAIVFCRQYILLRIRTALYYTLIVIIFIAMLLTGSKNGIVTLIVTLVCFIPYSLLKKVSVRKCLPLIKERTPSLVSVLVIIIGLIFVILYIRSTIEDGRVHRLLNRATHLSFEQEGSVMGRIRKFNIATDLVLNGPILIGIGLQSAPLSFYDGAIASLLISSGLCGIFIFITIILVFFVELHKKAVQNGRGSEFTILFFVSLNYFLANLITEFFLVSRSVIPFAIFLGLIAKMIQIPRCLPRVNAKVE